jgi:signal transduction histidine kinase/CheY-like chemotaxis protein
LTGTLLLGSAVIVLVLVRLRGAARPVTVSEAAPESAGQRAERLRNLLLTRMSHDLRTPLNSMITLAQLMVEENSGSLSNEQRRYLEVIHRNGQNLLALINDILDLSAVESGQVDLDVGVVNLTALVRDVASSCQPAARHKGIPLHVSLQSDTQRDSGPEAVVVQSDPDRLRQVIQHLVQHGIAETQNGYVEMVLTKENEPPQARLRIHDTGEGLSDAARRALTEDFRDLDTFILGEGRFAAPPAESLPLLLAARLSRRMGLRIGVQSSSADGVSFELTLPLAGADARIEAPQQAAPEGASAVRPSRPLSGHVLLIEDDLLERRRVAGQLEALGYDVTLAASGEEGLALLRDGHFDAVVLDLVMPGMSGLEVLRAARNDERLVDVPFVVLSALYMTRTERDVLGPKVTDVVRKGDATADELEVAIARAIAQVSSNGADRPPYDASHSK